MAIVYGGSEIGTGAPAGPQGPSSLSKLLSLDQSEQMRLRRYAQHWRFYADKHWQFAREDGDPLVTINYFRKVVDKGASFLVGNGFNTAVPPPLSGYTLPFLQEVWKDNEGPKLLWDIGLMGGVSGDAFVMPSYREPTLDELRVNPYAQPKITLTLHNSECVFPRFNPLNKNEIEAVKIVTLFHSAKGPTAGEPGEFAVPASVGSEPHVSMYVQTIDRSRIREEIDGRVVRDAPNALGVVPLVHIKNLPNPCDPYGIPDGLGLLDLNALLNEKATDLSDYVNYDAHPTTVITGAKADNLERGPGQIWSGFPPTARVETLGNSGDLGAGKDFLLLIKQAFMELSDVPESSLGRQQAISNTSAAALHMAYLPLMEKTKKKRAQYQAGFEQLNRLILRIAQQQRMIDLPFDIDKRSGGKIAMVLDQAPDADGAPSGNLLTTATPQSFRMDPATFAFEAPEAIKISHIRQHSFGQEVRESPYWQVVAEHRKVSKSYWDPSPQTTAKQSEQLQPGNNDAGAAEDDADTTPPQGVGLPTLPSQHIELPPEPVQVTVMQPQFDPGTGALLSEKRIQMFLVPTGNPRPQYLDPFDNEVRFNDPLPKDVHLYAQLCLQYLQMGIVSRRWVQEHIAEIAPDIDQIEREIKRDREAGMVADNVANTEAQGQESQRENNSTGSPSSPTNPEPTDAASD